MTTRSGAAASGEQSSNLLEMAELTRRHDWAATPLGALDAWPQSLRIAVDLMLASGHAMCLMWGPERVFLYNDAYAPNLGARHPTALGLPTIDVWPELWDQIQPLVERTFAGESCTFRELPLIMTRNGFVEETWWDFAYSPVRDETGGVAGLLNVTSDSTARVIAQRERDAALERLRAGEERLRESETFLSSVLAASTDCIKVVELDGTLSFMSEGGMRTMEVSDFNEVRGCPWPELLKEDGPTLARNALKEARQGRTVHFECPADTFVGNPRYWSVTVSPILGTDGLVSRVLSVSRDHTELERGREQQILLNGELAHRIKNLMSVVQAIAHQTLRTVTDKDAVKAFSDRLAALSSSHNLLSGQNWSATAIGDLTLAALRTFGEDRFVLSGPKVQIGPRATLALSLMLHELATNAVKYGSLSVPNGRVGLDWSVRRQGDEDEFRLTWTETGGPPAVEPTRKGFGSRIIRMGLIGSGGVELRYGAQGLTVEASAPLDQMQEA